MREIYYYLAAGALALSVTAYGEYLEFTVEYDDAAYTETEETGGDGNTYILRVKCHGIHEI